MLSDFGLDVIVQGVVDINFFQVLGTLGYVAPKYLVDGMPQILGWAFKLCLWHIFFPKKSHPRKINIININFLCYECPHDIDFPLLR